jgi:hypothetical protein
MYGSGSINFGNSTIEAAADGTLYVSALSDGLIFKAVPSGE